MECFRERMFGRCLWNGRFVRHVHRPEILPAPANVLLTAASLADSSRNNATAIVITSSFSVSVAGPASVTAGNTATYAPSLTIPLNSNPSRVISWSVTSNGCAGSACGTISSGGVFTAPAQPPSPAIVQMVATPLADPSKAASLPVSILSAVKVSISPSAATLALTADQLFQATVSGAQDPTVTWDVDGVVGGNSMVGTILNSQTDPNNTTYQSPPTMPADGAVTVRARSNADPSVSASATIGFTAAVYVTLTPTSATLALGEGQTFAVEVNNTANQNVTWSVNAIPGGNSTVGRICVTGSRPCQPVSTTSDGAVDYFAPAGVPSPNPITITAASQAPNAQNAAATVTILPHIVVSVQPGSASSAANGQARFTASIAGTGNQQVIWTITGAGCRCRYPRLVSGRGSRRPCPHLQRLSKNGRKSGVNA